MSAEQNLWMAQIIHWRKKISPLWRVISRKNCRKNYNAEISGRRFTRHVWTEGYAYWTVQHDCSQHWKSGKRSSSDVRRVEKRWWTWKIAEGLWGEFRFFHGIDYHTDCHNHSPPSYPFKHISYHTSSYSHFQLFLREFSCQNGRFSSVNHRTNHRTCFNSRGHRFSDKIRLRNEYVAAPYRLIPAWINIFQLHI